MSIQEIINIEDRNKGEIHLYKEGIFWKAYQQSAYHFTREVRAFKISKKMVKSVGREVVSLGFPKNALEQYFSKEKLTEINEKQLLITGYTFKMEDYQQWLESLPLVSKQKQTNDRQPINKEDAVLALLLGFRVERSTPMECMQLVVSLQKMLDGSL